MVLLTRAKRVSAKLPFAPLVKGLPIIPLADFRPQILSKIGINIAAYLESESSLDASSHPCDKQSLSIASTRAESQVHPNHPLHLLRDQTVRARS